MSRSSYLLRGSLYVAIAVLQSAAQYLPPLWAHAATVVGTGLLALRAYIDTSSTQVLSAITAPVLAKIAAGPSAISPDPAVENAPHLSSPEAQPGA